MNEELVLKLEQYIEAIIDKKIESAFGRDGLYESVRANSLRQELRQELFELISK